MKWVVGLLLLVLLLMLGCTSARPPIQGVNCGNSGSQVNSCMVTNGMRCSAAYGQMEMDGVLAYAQILGVENGQCHVYAEAKQNGLSASMQCLLPKDSQGNYLTFTGNERIKQYCSGLLADLIDERMAR